MAIFKVPRENRELAYPSGFYDLSYPLPTQLVIEKQLMLNVLVWFFEIPKISTDRAECVFIYEAFGIGYLMICSKPLL